MFYAPPTSCCMWSFHSLVSLLILQFCVGQQEFFREIFLNVVNFSVLDPKAKVAPWFTEELRELKRKGRRLERRWRKSNLESDKDLCRAHKVVYNEAINAAKEKYFSKEKAAVSNSTEKTDTNSTEKTTDSDNAQKITES